jgi:ActR/RegA family two-component response regulator
MSFNTRSLTALCILNPETGETVQILTFTSTAKAIQYVISCEAGYLEDPDEIDEIYRELEEHQCIFAHDNLTRSSYQLIPTSLVE